MADFDVAMDGEAEEDSDSDDSAPIAKTKKKKKSRKKKASPAASPAASPNLGTRRGGRQRKKTSYVIPDRYVLCCFVLFELFVLLITFIVLITYLSIFLPSSHSAIPLSYLRLAAMTRTMCTSTVTVSRYA